MHGHFSQQENGRTSNDTFTLHTPNSICTKRNVLYLSGEASKREPADECASFRDGRSKLNIAELPEPQQMTLEHNKGAQRHPRQAYCQRDVPVLDVIALIELPVTPAAQNVTLIELRSWEEFDTRSKCRCRQSTAQGKSFKVI